MVTPKYRYGTQVSYWYCDIVCCRLLSLAVSPSLFFFCFHFGFSFFKKHVYISIYLFVPIPRRGAGEGGKAVLGRVVLSEVSYPVRANRGYGFLPAGGAVAMGWRGRGGDAARMDGRKFCVWNYSGYR